MTYRPETQDQRKIERGTASGGAALSGGLAPGDERIMKAAMLAMGPGQESDSLALLRPFDTNYFTISKSTVGKVFIVKKTVDHPRTW